MSLAGDASAARDRGIDLVLVDSSVWMAHERSPDDELRRLLQAGRAAGTEEVIHEISLGCGARPLAIAADIRLLPRIPSVPDPIDDRIESLGLRCKGIGIADARIILAALDAGARLYSKDRGMTAAARALGLLHPGKAGQHSLAPYLDPAHSVA